MLGGPAALLWPQCPAASNAVFRRSARYTLGLMVIARRSRASQKNHVPHARPVETWLSGGDDQRAIDLDADRALVRRKRTTPPSFRFLGRKVYLGAVVVLICAMRQGAAAARQLSELFGVSRRTIARWREWWRSAFVASPFWRAAAAAFMPPVDHDRLPASLTERFTGSGGERLVALLRFIAPITGSDRHTR
jgi:hypothetical protein